MKQIRKPELEKMKEALLEDRKFIKEIYLKLRQHKPRKGNDFHSLYELIIKD